MASETVANLLDVYKEVWTENRLEKQFYDGTKWFDKVERTNKYTIGRKATVGLETSLPGGTTTTLAAGSDALNSADPLHVDTAEYTLSYPYQQVDLQIAALNQGDAVGMRSVVDTMDRTIKSNVLALRKEINRQMVSNGDALIALTTGTAASAEVELDPAGYGYDALRRGWLRKGLTVDVGTTASEASVTADKKITAVEISTTTPSITLASSVTLSGTTYVSVANNRSGSTSAETNGLRNVVGSASSTVGTLAPSTEPTWAPAKVDTTTTLVSLDLLVSLQQEVVQQTGDYPSAVFASPKQCGELYKLFQSQVRFAGDNPTAGNVKAFTWGGFDITQDPDIPDRELYLLDPSSFIIVTGGGIGKPTWVSDIEGSGGRLRWVQGTTRLTDAVTYPIQLGSRRRNSNAAAIGLTA